MAPKPMDILFLTDDQHRWDWFGDTGTVPTLRTPHLDALRSGSTVCTNAWSNCPICVPTRFSWYSGLYASQGSQGVLTNSAGWPDHVPYLPQLLQARGWRTALIGKLHHLDGRQVTRDLAAPAYVLQAKARGFDHVWEVGGRSQAAFHDCQWTHHLRRHGLLDRYRLDLADRHADRCWNEPYRVSVVPAEHQVDALIADQAVAWLEQAPTDRPFFVHASFCGPHFPLDPPEGWFGRHRPQDMPPPQGLDDPLRRAYWQEQRAAYADLLAFVDHQVGRVLAALDRRGLAGDTLVVFTSDHGDRLGDQGWWHKSQPQDGSCRVPLAFRLPGRIPAGQVRDGFLGAIDLPATLLEAAGVTLPLNHLLPDSPGRSAWQYVATGGQSVRSRLYAETSGWRMVTDAGWKYVRYDGGQDALFDRHCDPHDLRDLAEAAANRETLSTMRAALIDEMMACRAPNAPDYWPQRDQARHRSEVRPEHHPQVPAGTWWQTDPRNERDPDAH